jgi:hypothetical protein
MKVAVGDEFNGVKQAEGPPKQRRRREPRRMLVTISTVSQGSGGWLEEETKG